MPENIYRLIGRTVTCDDVAMIPYRYYGLIIGAICLLVAIYAIVSGVLGLFGVGDANVWTLLIGVVMTAFGVAGLKDFVEKEERAQARARRRRRIDH